MEKKISREDKKNMKKLNINADNSSFIMKLKELYNTKIIKLHIVFVIIMVVIYTILFISSISSAKNGNLDAAIGLTATAFTTQITEYALLSLVLIFAGITPYFYFSILGVIQIWKIIDDVIIRHMNNASLIPTLYIGGLIQIIGISLCIAIGVYYCRLTTKKNKYYKQSGFTFDDVRLQLYEIRKNEKKIDEINKKKEKKAKIIQESNIKIPVLYFYSIGVVALVIEIIGVLIAKI